MNGMKATVSCGVYSFLFSSFLLVQVFAVNAEAGLSLIIHVNIRPPPFLLRKPVITGEAALLARSMRV